MAKLTDFVPQEEIDAALAADDVVEAKMALAEEIVGYAQSIAPEDEGAYRNGIRARRRGATGVSVEFSDSKSNIIEYGSEDTPEFAVQARTEAYFRGAGG